MYSKQEAAHLKKEFWTTFGLYLVPVLSADGEKISWVNYKTGEKHVHFRLHADAKLARIAIELSHPDEGVRQLYFEQFLQLKNLLHQALGEKWTWELQAADDYGKPLSRIFIDRPGVSVFRREDWPALISFFKPRLLALDEFWSGAKYAFQALR